MKNILSCALPVLLVSVLFISAPASAQKFTLRVNAGGGADYTDKAGNIWKADKAYAKGGGYGFVGGDTVDRGDIRIDGTADPKIYQTEHYSMDAFVAEVPDGTYTVRLHFAETYDEISSEGQRVFDVKIQGVVLLKDFDVRGTAEASQTAVVKEFKGVAAKDGLLRIDFVPNVQNPEINGIEILRE